MTWQRSHRWKISQKRSHSRVVLAVFALLFGIYLLTTGGHTNSKDEELLFGVSETLVLWKSFALNAARSHEAPFYSPYGPGQPIATIPLYLLGKGIASFFPNDAYPWVTRAIVLWFNPLITAGTAALLYLAAVFLGYGRRAAVGVALIYGLATLAWPYSKTFFSEPLTSLLLFASFTLLLYLYEKHRHNQRQSSVSSSGYRSFSYRIGRYRSDNKTRNTKRGFLLLSGVLAGLAPAVKIQAIIALPLLLLYIAITAFRNGEHPHLSCPWFWPLMGRLIVWGVGVAASLALLLAYQWAIYGNPLNSGYGNVGDEFGSNHLWYRLNGLIWSSGRGILWYAPPMLLWPLSLWLLWRRTWQAALVAGLIVVVNMVFHAHWIIWTGGGCWGPRFLHITMPFMVLPLAAFLQTLRGWRTPWRTGALVVTLVLAVPVQAAGVAIANEAYFSKVRGTNRVVFNLHDSPIVGHLGMIASQFAHYYHLYMQPESVALEGGFSYSEGDREQGEQTPRWTHPQATIALRPPEDTHTLLLSLSLQGCLPPPLPPTQATLQIDPTTEVALAPCPPRIYRFVLPAEQTSLELVSSPWNPQQASIERDEVLGVMLRAIAARAGGEPLAVQGTLVPITTMPTGYVSIRRWTGDHRFVHWDFWWWYVQFSDLPDYPLQRLLVAWVALAVVGIAWGTEGVVSVMKERT
jgi:hypothetical protein